MAISSNFPMDSQSPTTLQNIEKEKTYYFLYVRKNLKIPEEAEWITHHFDINIIAKGMQLSGHRLIGFVLDSCAMLRRIGFAEVVWNYITKDQKCDIAKPNQLLYSKMMRVYRRHARKSIILLDEWMEQYRTDPVALKGHLCNLDLESPVILNQMMRCLVEVGGARSQIIYYFVKMIDLDICGA